MHGSPFLDSLDRGNDPALTGCAAKWKNDRQSGYGNIVTYSILLGKLDIVRNECHVETEKYEKNPHLGYVSVGELTRLLVQHAEFLYGGKYAAF